MLPSKVGGREYTDAEWRCRGRGARSIAAPSRICPPEYSPPKCFPPKYYPPVCSPHSEHTTSGRNATCQHVCSDDVSPATVWGLVISNPLGLLRSDIICSIKIFSPVWGQWGWEISAQGRVCKYLGSRGVPRS